MNLYKIHGSCPVGQKMSFSISSSSHAYMMKLVEKNSDAYKPIVENSLLLPPLIVFAKRNELLLAMLHYIYLTRTE